MIQLGSLAKKKRKPVWNGGFTLCGCFFSVNGCFFSENGLQLADIVCVHLNGLLRSRGITALEQTERPHISQSKALLLLHNQPHVGPLRRAFCIHVLSFSDVSYFSANFVHCIPSVTAGKS